MALKSIRKYMNQTTNNRRKLLEGLGCGTGAEMRFLLAAVLVLRTLFNFVSASESEEYSSNSLDNEECSSDSADYEDASAEFKLACRAGNLEEVKHILNEANNLFYYEGVQAAAEAGHLEVVKTILAEHTFDADEIHSAATLGACQTDQLDVLKFIISQTDYEPSYDNSHVLRWACSKGNMEIFYQLFYSHGAQPSVNDNECIRMASANGHTKIVKELLADIRVDPFAHNDEALVDAILNGHEEIVKLLASDYRPHDPLLKDALEDDSTTDNIREICVLASVCMNDDVIGFDELKHLFYQFGPKFFDDICSNVAGPEVGALMDGMKYEFIKGHLPKGLAENIDKEPEIQRLFQTLNRLRVKSKKIINVIRYYFSFDMISVSFGLPNELKFKLALEMAGLENIRGF